MSEVLSEPAKLLLLLALLAKDGIISNNSKAFLKELVLRRDPRLPAILKAFESKNSANDSTFLEEIHELIVDESQVFYDELFSDTSIEVGKTLSKDERDQKNLNNEKSLIYGEIEYKSFYRVLRKINANPGQTFYDLGSGTAKALMAARFTQDFSRCIGVEILENLHKQAKVIVGRYNHSFRGILTNGQSQDCAVYLGSFLDFDWSDGDVVFANSTCFDDNLMIKMSDVAERLRPGAIFVTFTKGLTSDKFEVLERKRYKMSWGPATVYIHRRLGDDGRPVGPAGLNLLPSDAIDYDAEVRNGGGTKVGVGSFAPSKIDDIDDDDDDDDDDYSDDEYSDDDDYEEGGDDGDDEYGDDDEDGQGNSNEESERLYNQAYRNLIVNRGSSSTKATAANADTAPITAHDANGDANGDDGGIASMRKRTQEPQSSASKPPRAPGSAVSPMPPLNLSASDAGSIGRPPPMSPGGSVGSLDSGRDTPNTNGRRMWMNSPQDSALMLRKRMVR